VLRGLMHDGCRRQTANRLVAMLSLVREGAVTLVARTPSPSVSSQITMRSAPLGPSGFQFVRDNPMVSETQKAGPARSPRQWRSVFARRSLSSVTKTFTLEIDGPSPCASCSLHRERLLAFFEKRSAAAEVPGGGIERDSSHQTYSNGFTSLGSFRVISGAVEVRPGRAAGSLGRRPSECRVSEQVLEAFRVSPRAVIVAPCGV